MTEILWQGVQTVSMNKTGLNLLFIVFVILLCEIFSELKFFKTLKSGTFLDSVPKSSIVSLQIFEKFCTKTR